jgi:hypothetical protein
MFKRLKGKTKIMYFKGDTALQVRDGGLVALTDSGTVTPLRNDTTDRPVGVCRRNDTTTDSALVPVEVPVEDYVEWLIDVDSDGGAADSDVGRYCAVDTTGGNSVLAGDSCGMRVDINDTTIRTIWITGKNSATQIRGVIAKRASAVQDTV